MKDCRVKVHDIAGIIGISDRMHNILYKKLEMKKLCARWMPRLLTIDQKRLHSRNGKIA